MRVPFFNFKKSFLSYEKEINEAIKKTLLSGWYILGKELDEFEKKFADYCGAKFCIGVGNGLDALKIIIKAYKELGMLKDDDEVIVPANTYIATIISILDCGLKPVFVEPELDYYNIDPVKIDEAITKNTKAIMAVHLYGQLAKMDLIKKISLKYKLITIEDCAQSHGAKNEKGISSGSLSDASGFSFYPSKNLGAYGDGGAIFTRDESIAKKCRQVRVHGQSQRYLHTQIGVAGRMDTIQAAILLAKLEYFTQELKDRKIVADRYTNGLTDIVQTPIIKQNISSAWAQYTIRVNNRDDIQNELKKKDIPTSVFYPVSLHLQECFKYLNYKQGDFSISEKSSNEVISLPMNPFLTYDQIDYIILKIKEHIS